MSAHTSPDGPRDTTPSGPPQLLLTIARGQLWIEGTGPVPLPTTSVPAGDTEGALAIIGRWIMEARAAVPAGAP